MALCNALVYDDRLQCATQAVENDTLKLKNWSSVEMVIIKLQSMTFIEKL